MSATTNHDHKSSTQRGPRHIGIIGAGVAGLRCATVLLDKGYRVTILEGSTRLGGRLAQAECGGHVVDLGPNWIHGTEENPIYELVKQMQTGTCSFEEDGVSAVFGRDGWRVGSETASMANEILWDVIGQASRFSALHKNDDTISKGESLMDHLREHVPEAVRSHMRQKNEKSQSEDISTSQEQMIDLVLSMADIWGAYVGSTTEKQSLKYLWLEECLDGENLFCAGTYSKVLQAIVDQLQDRAELVLQSVIKTIVGKTSEAEQVRVLAEDGREWLFDEVVMTAPLGWLKRNMDCFKVPALPEGFAAAVESIGYGTLDKVYISFEEPFWDKSATITPNDSSPSTAVNLETSSTPSTNQTQAISTFLQPSYLPATPALRDLTQNAFHLSALPQANAHPTLLFYTTDATTTHLSSLIPHNTPYAIDKPAPTDPILAHFLPYLTLLLPSPSSSSSSSSSSSTAQAVPQPTSLLFTNWRAAPLAGHGSYTFFPAGQDRLDSSIAVLRRGMPEQGVWIAGEHVAPFVALGTVSGAWMSGEAVAARICEAIDARK